jgi:cell division septum initiation protein DivIVA
MEIVWIIIAFAAIMWPVERLRDRQHKDLQKQIAELRAQLLRAEERLANAAYNSAQRSAEEIMRVMP